MVKFLTTIFLSFFEGLLFPAQTIISRFLPTSIRVFHSTVKTFDIMNMLPELYVIKTVFLAGFNLLNVSQFR